MDYDGALTSAPSEILGDAPVPTLEQTEVSDREKLKGSLTKHAGWEIFREDYLKSVQDLENMVGYDPKNKTREEIGEDWLTAKAAAARMRAELTKVEAIAKATDRKRRIAEES